MKLLRNALKSIAWKLFPFAQCTLKTASRLKIPIESRDALSGVQEIFIDRVYHPYLEGLSNVKSWVDVGCNVGYFSLWLHDSLGKGDHKALLLDANPLSCKMAQKLVLLNALQNSFRVENKVIGPDGAEVSFFARGTCTGNSIFRDQDPKKRGSTVRSSSLQSIAGTDSYDLIKIDIEGGEKFLFENESERVLQFRLGLAEWHAPHWTGNQMREWLEKNKCRTVKVIPSDLSRPDPFLSSRGTVLWETR